ncbi:DUF1656 domain-containing protein [Synechococcus sp. RSCCF101]|uniref:DUF1656 domain-containing protein n=1 Tax=Synechococcus sp. RSCCF101 TaxID=2511069 RepID=UPI001246C57E|nr:DUF1656 domain-containing protein [Synechococcus sp. RSCCF101]QEY31001.1 DUF1656 domain-containing protein [Synechococcus sp. RSCCF101]
MTQALFTPKEVEFRGIYLSPLLVSVALAIAATWFTCKTLNRYGLADRFESPLLVYLSFVVIYTVLISTLLIPS